MKNTLVLNLVGLYGIQLANAAVLVAMLYFARIMGEGFGLLAFSYSFALIISLVVEYGFSFSATRELAKQADPTEVSNLVSGVLSAKACLVLATVPLAIAAFFATEVFRQQPLFFVSAWVFGVTLGMNCSWYFQGVEKMLLGGSLDFLGRILGVGVALVGIHYYPMGILVYLALPMALMYVYMHYLMVRQTAVTLKPLAEVLQILRMGWSMFLYRSLVSLYTSANVFILGFLATQSMVAHFAAADRVAKVFLTLLGPVSQAFYPRLARLRQEDPNKAVVLGRQALGIMGLSGTVLGLVMYAIAPLVPQILGKSFEASVPIVQVLALVVPLISVSTVLGTNWLLVYNMDKAFNTNVMLGALLNIALPIFLIPRVSTIGMAWSVVLAEAVVALGMYITLRKAGINPLQRSVR
jgi:polysaccharide transporter, PST family